MADAPLPLPESVQERRVPGHMMCPAALPPWIITFNDTVEWLGVFMDNGFACTKENATESATKLDWERQSARTHDVSAAPPPDLYLLFNEVCHGAWDCLARRESHWAASGSCISRVLVGLSLKHAPTPVCASKAKRTRPRAPHDSSLID